MLESTKKVFGESSGQREEEKEAWWWNEGARTSSEEEVKNNKVRFSEPRHTAETQRKRVIVSCM